MRILVVHGSKRGGTEGIARTIGEALAAAGVATEVRPAIAVDDVVPYDVVLVGGALYAGRWPRPLSRFVKRHAEALRARTVWFFSSGPLGKTAATDDPPPTPQVAGLMKRAGARGHVTFGGRLEPDAKGLIAHAMAKKFAGDWRDPERIRRWALDVLERSRPKAAAAGQMESRA